MLLKWMRLQLFRAVTSIVLSLVLWVGIWPTPRAQAQDPSLREALFGDLHTHTAYSLDANAGFMANDPNTAYQFARGDSIPVLNDPLPNPDGTPRNKQLLEGFDFNAITDHAEFIGEVEMALDENNPCYNHPLAKAIRNEPKSELLSIFVFVNILQGATRSEGPAQRTEYGASACADAARKTAWQKLQQATEYYNEPGTFTTLHAFEWSSAPGGANLHRNVIFKDTNLPTEPYSLFDSQAPEDLWNQLSQYEQNLGTTVLAIPHNSNASAGQMFKPQTFEGKDIDPAWAELRAKYEPLVEIMQIKGTSETLPRYAPEDQFAKFELFPEDARTLGKYGYVREALKNGLRHEASLGTNPFKYGIIGATDNHNGSSGDTQETEYIGSHGFTDATPALRLTSEIPNWESLPNLNPGALTGVWADANTREDIFDALARKETFGTSGTRTKVRLFGGWEFPLDLHDQADAIAQAYDTGVPMGGDLMGEDVATLPADIAPKFMMMAMRDVHSATLDRLQIVKGWTKHGLTYEKVYDVALAGGNRSEDELPIDSQIDIDVAAGTVTYDPESGDPELKITWEDPDFDPTVRTFYYLRALEVPSPRYSAYDYVDPSVTDDDRKMFLTFGQPLEIQERAWSSPIWYTPTPEQLAEGDIGALTVGDASLVPLTEAQTFDLMVNNYVEIANLQTGDALTNFYGPLGSDNAGIWVPVLENASGGGSLIEDDPKAAALHVAENFSPTRIYGIADNQVSFNLEDGSEFVAELFDQNGQVVAARDDEIGYVNYQVEMLEEFTNEPCCPSEVGAAPLGGQNAAAEGCGEQQA